MAINKEIIKQAIVKKNNALTDGYIPKPPKQVLPDKLLNALYWKFENEGERFSITLSELRGLLGLKSSKDDHRIIEAIGILQAPIFLRNFEYQGREIEWTSAPFLSEATKYKDGRNIVEFAINPKVIAALKQKYGYTPLEIEICNRFKTKYGLKLYEMFRRYETLPNGKGEGVGTIAKSIEELNKLFGTKYQHPSKIKEGIDRGLKEIEKHTGILITVFWDKIKKKFVFSWGQEPKETSYPFMRSKKAFISYLRKHYVNKGIVEAPNANANGQISRWAIAPDGHIYDMYAKEENVNALRSGEIYTAIYEHAKANERFREMLANKEEFPKVAFL